MELHSDGGMVDDGNLLYIRAANGDLTSLRAMLLDVEKGVEANMIVRACAAWSIGLQLCSIVVRTEEFQLRVHQYSICTMYINQRPRINAPGLGRRIFSPNKVLTCSHNCALTFLCPCLSMYGGSSSGCLNFQNISHANSHRLCCFFVLCGTTTHSTLIMPTKFIPRSVFTSTRWDGQVGRE